MSQIIDDNGVVGFTRQVTLNVSGACILDDFKTTLGNNAEFERTNNQSQTTGYKAAKGIIKGSATAQIATSSVDPHIFWGQTFSTTIGGTLYNFVINETGDAESKNGETKAPITFRQTVGTVTVT